MAKQQPPKEESAPVFSEADQARARQWFKKAAETRERREYDYAIECYITGLGFWPEAVEEAYMPLRALALQRQQAGGKKPGMMDELKKPISGKDAKQALLNALLHWTKDPRSGKYIDAILKNAVKAGYLEAASWAAGLAMESFRAEAKPGKSRLTSILQALGEGVDKAELRGETPAALFLLETALQGLEFLLVRMPTDESLRDELKALSGRFTILKGKYAEADSFRDSIRDADAQKALHDQERSRQGEQTQVASLAAARKAYEANPGPGPALSTYLDLLLKSEHRAEEDEAIAILTKTYEQSRNYSYRMRADDIRLRQLSREARRLAELARQSGQEDDRQQARLAALEQRQAVLAVYRERVQEYPTDLRLKYKLGEVLFQVGEFDEAIPVLQAAQHEPRNRIRCQMLIGRAFFEKGAFRPAADALREAVEAYELTDDLSNDLLYWWGRAAEADGQAESAKEAYGRLLRQNYNYANGDARERLKALSA